MIAALVHQPPAQRAGYNNGSQHRLLTPWTRSDDPEMLEPNTFLIDLPRAL